MTNILTGWINTASDHEAAVPQIKSMLALTPEAELNQQLFISPFLVCAGSQKSSIEYGQCVLILYGAPPPIRGEQLKQFIDDYKQNGLSFINRLNFGFALLLADLADRKLILATDPIGQRHLYYSQTPNGLVFGATADNVVAHPEVDNDIALQSIYDYVYFHHCPSPTTIYRQVSKLENGQLLTYQAGKVELQYYWLPEYHEKLNVSLEDAGKQLQQTLTDAVRHLTVDARNTGAFLSGGLDSSSVAGALSSVYPNEAKTFSIGFDVEGYDEIGYARIAAQHFNTQQYEYYVTPEDTVDAVAKIAAYYDEPFGNSSALAVYYCAKLAKRNGIELLLGGDGGDELFAGNERYSKQLLFEPYQKIPGFMRKLLQGGLDNAPSVLLENRFCFKAKRYIEQAEVPLPDRLQDYNFLHRHPAAEIFTDDFVQQIDTKLPLQGWRDCYQRPTEASALNRMLYLDWKTTLHDNDLVKVNKMCELAGVDVQYPLLDRSMLELSCRIPSHLKIKQQKLRWFYKQSVSDLLPEQIINKSKHGFGLPFGIWLKDHPPLKALAYDSLGDLKKRGYFRPGFIDHAINMHQTIHAAYYGELIWVLMMLELWLRGKKL